MNNDQKEELNTIDSKKKCSLLFFTSNKIDHAEQDFWIHSNILNVDKRCSVRITRTIQERIHLNGSLSVSYLLLMMELNTNSVFWVSFMQSVCVCYFKWRNKRNNTLANKNTYLFHTSICTSFYVKNLGGLQKIAMNINN